MARHGTLPEFMYQRQREILENPVSIAFDVQSDDTSDDAAVNQLEEEEGDNFDESSDEEVEEDSTLLQGVIGSSATFLIGARTRYGRAVRFDNRLLH